MTPGFRGKNCITNYSNHQTRADVGLRFFVTLFTLKKMSSIFERFTHENGANPRFFAAPMVDLSHLAFRQLCRKYGAQVCYTPMFHASMFSANPGYRAENFTTCSQDRPLVVQFCANNPEKFVHAAKLVQDECDAVDLNLGCPQVIAKRDKFVTLFY
uniref:DUS-like FMN-binding domain-containing protein n=1 Tax=Strigamia maritima TaxID=126957 RepID=T1J7A8_STRMM